MFRSSYRSAVVAFGPVVLSSFGLVSAACGESTVIDEPGPAARTTGTSPSSTAPTVAPTVTGSDAGPPVPTDPCALAPLRRAFWGDLHVHTSYSLDSYVVDNRNDPVAAYAFARKTGQATIGNDAANKVSIDRKLDFAVVTDHSEFLDVMEECTLDPTHPSYASQYCTGYRDNGATSAAFIGSFAQLARENPSEPAICDGPIGNQRCIAARRSAWQRLQSAANTATQSDCSFTALIGFEWTAQTRGNNLHRNVIFGSETVPAAPLDYIHYPTINEVWSGLDAQCTGACKALVVPHNSNASNGQMWAEAENASAHPSMRKYQKLVEVYQHKGNSECAPGDGGVSDPECAFEISGNFLGGDGGVREASRPGFVREGLGRGLELVHGADAAANPLAMGFLGSTDTHNGAPGYVAEGSDAGPKWQGHLATTDDTPKERIEDNANFSPGGITGVWARNNTRGELFAALDRRETFATSGPRIVARFHAKSGVASQAEADAYCSDPDYPSKLEAAGGVPMGRDLALGGDTWVFMMVAKDQTDLEKIDFVSVRTDTAGKAVASVDSVPLRTDQGAVACVARKLAPLAAGSRGLVYGRAYEKETWRWSHYDCQDPSVSGSAPCAAGLPASAGGLDVKIRERVWTSPIFFR